MRLSGEILKEKPTFFYQQIMKKIILMQVAGGWTYLKGNMGFVCDSYGQKTVVRC